MPKSKRNKTVDLSKTKKHGLEGKKELYKKTQSNVENYAHIFVFAVNDMRNSKMKNVREQWKHSRFCIGKNKVMAMALGRTPEEEYRTNLHKIGQMLIGERGLLFTNQSIDEVTNWFQSYSEGDYARSGNVATEDVILPEGPLTQFPHNLESYLRQLGLPTTLKKGVIHLVKEHLVCTEGERLSPETARILKLLGYEMAEFQLKILSVWSQDGSFVDLQSNLSDPESKENAANAHRSFMKEDFELAKDCLLLGDDDDEMEVANNDPAEENFLNNSESKSENDSEEQKSVEAEKISGDGELSENKTSSDIEEENEPKITNSRKSKIEKETNADEVLENNTNSETVSTESKSETENSSIPANKPQIVNEEMEVEEPLVKKPKTISTAKKSGKNTKKTVKQTAKEREEQTAEIIVRDEDVSSKEEIIDSKAILKLTERKIEETTEKPKKFSPKMTRARAAAANKKIKTPEPLETKRTRKRKM